MTCNHGRGEYSICFPFVLQSMIATSATSSILGGLHPTVFQHSWAHWFIIWLSEANRKRFTKTLLGCSPCPSLMGPRVGSCNLNK